MIYLFYALHIVVCLFLILVVLLQQGKGADLSVFGGGSTQTAFGARGAATLLHKLTVISFILFIVTTMSIALMSGIGTGSSVIDDEEEVEATPGAPLPLPGADPADLPADDLGAGDDADPAGTGAAENDTP